MPNLRKIILFYIDIEWSGTAPVGIEHLLNKQLRYIQLHPVTDTAVDAERISLAFTEAIRAHTSRGGAEPYLRFARIRMGSLIGANSLIRHSFTCHRVSALFLLNHILAILFSKFILCISVLSLLFLVVRIPC